MARLPVAVPVTGPCEVAEAAGPPHTGSVEEMVCELARDKLAEADDLLRGIEPGWSPPPYDAVLVAHALGIRCETGGSLMGRDAMVYMRAASPTILYREGMPPGRARLSIFHEIAHTFLGDYQFNTGYWRPRRPRILDPGGQLESLCDVAAAELAMPMEPITEDLILGGFGASQVGRLCERYGVEAESVCLRMMESELENCALARIETRRLSRPDQRRLFGHKRVGEARLRTVTVEYAVPSTAFRRAGCCIPRHITLASDSCVVEAARTKRDMAGDEVVQFVDGREQQFRVEALPLREARSRNGRCPVLAFFYPV